MQGEHGTPGAVSSPSSVVHYHLRVAYDRIMAETMRRLRQQQGGLSVALLDELEARWRAQLEDVLDVPELQTVATKARSMKRHVDFLSAHSSDPKHLKAEPATHKGCGLAKLDLGELRKKLGQSAPSKPPLFASFGFQPLTVPSPPHQPPAASPALAPVLELKLPDAVVEAPAGLSDSESEDYNGLLEDGAVEGEDGAPLVECRGSARARKTEAARPRTEPRGAGNDNLPELSAIDDVPDVDAGSVLGSDLDSDAWSEPEIEDHIYATHVEIKSRKNGVWRVNLQNGVCKINKQETLFKQATCFFNFTEWSDEHPQHDE
eukprot:GEMP01004709.1.p2 GENE.GEMP01004709.1~~GEMP01004709.1.p2  ORF type:complete len:319 (-),score=98.76 GEMP01004709.1:2598-3554(-)